MLTPIPSSSNFRRRETPPAAISAASHFAVPLVEANYRRFSRCYAFSSKQTAPPLQMSPFRSQLSRKLPVVIPVSDSCHEGGVENSNEFADEKVKLTAIVTIRRSRREFAFQRWAESALQESVGGRRVFLQLISATHVDPKTGCGVRSDRVALQGWTENWGLTADKVQYVAEFTVSRRNFGAVGAMAVENQYTTEFFLETVSLQRRQKHGGEAEAYFSCYSWVQPWRYRRRRRDMEEEEEEMSVFFSNDSYLPAETPAGLRWLREREMASLRGSEKSGDGYSKGMRVYDYDVYNDGGDPDRSMALKRPVVGGTPEFPYPRRLRTARRRTNKDPNAEQPPAMGHDIYVPRHEEFHETKQNDFFRTSLIGALQQLSTSLPSVDDAIFRHRESYVDDFRSFHDIDKLYRDSRKYGHSSNRSDDVVARILKKMSSFLHYPLPEIVSEDRRRWMRDDEFGRQLLAGANPVQIRRLQEFPIKSKLHPSIYGSPLSAITEEHLLPHLEGLNLDEAIQKRRLYILDYHDVYMPFVAKVNAMEGRKMYATRTILFHTMVGNLIPIVIELSLPPSMKHGHHAHRHVVTRAHGGHNVTCTTHWKWQLAKAHVNSNDAGFHQLVNHWLRSHAVMEPFIIASNRQLSHMHPIFKFLKPHFRYTLKINAYARQFLINADGIIENTFTTGRYSLEISSYAYRSWRFDNESLPADLINRGMAIEDPTSPHGLRLLVEDYPYASDGILLWSSIISWVNEYVSLYYKEDMDIEDDVELQAWWDEVKNKGHPDKKDEPWWPRLISISSLKTILSTIIWLASGFHAAINFGQYAYGGYVPNRPCMTRRLIPTIDDDPIAYQEFTQDPKKFFLSSISSKSQTTTLMTIVQSLSTHSQDEEYLGQRIETNWTSDQRAIYAFKQFTRSMESLSKIVHNLNEDSKLTHRNGTRIPSYQLLMPTSCSGRTCRGVPNSISI